jgi:hypothetical protein
MFLTIINSTHQENGVLSWLTYLYLFDHRNKATPESTAPITSMMLFEGITEF